jgi:hypothetical protein
MTALAGKLMPVLNVDVATSISRYPFLYPLSIINFSSLVKPEWWYAMPFKIDCFRIEQRPEGH